MSNPYDWPFPSRKDLMSLQTIKLLLARHDVGTQRPTQIKGEDYNLKVQDIHGAQPCMRPYLYVNKETFVNRVEDITGTRSRALLPSKEREVLTYSRNVFQKAYSGLKCDDIRGARPQVSKFVTGRPPTNPVEPVYAIPKSVPIEVTPPKFIRDQMNIDDIPGTKPFPPYAKLRKQVHKFDEIEGTRPKQSFLPRDHIEILDVKDINEYRQFKTTRVTNPLDPSYILRNDLSEQIEYGYVANSKSRQLHPQLNKPQSTSLITNDIQGCKVEAITDHFLMRNKRKDFRETNLTSDLPATKVGSLHKGLGHIRGTNPLNPDYQVPGRSEGQPQFSRQMSAHLPTRGIIQEQQKRDSRANQNLVDPAPAPQPPTTKIDPFFYPPPPRNNIKPEPLSSKQNEARPENNNMSNTRPEKASFSKFDPKDSSQRLSSAQRIERFIQK